AVTRAHLAAVAAGEAPERDVILSGAPWRDVPPAEALALYEKTPGLFVLDVRTPAEYASGHIPNAHLIPVDELEDRLRELPPKDTPLLIHCAAGGRSTAACQTLGLSYGIDSDQSAIAVKMTLTSEGCPSARTIPEDVRRKIAALGQPNVTVDVVWDPPWHPSRISPDGKQKLGLG